MTELVGRLLIILSSYCHKKYRKPKNKGLETDTVWKCQAATASEDCEPETLNQSVPGEALPVSDPGYITGWISLTSCAISPLSVGSVRPLLH